MEILRLRRPPRHALSPLNQMKRSKNNEEGMNCSAFAEDTACKTCIGSGEYIAMLSSALQDVFQQNLALKNRAKALEQMAVNLNLTFQNKKKMIKELKQTINTYTN